MHTVYMHAVPAAHVLCPLPPCRVEALGGDLVDKLIKLYEQLYFAPRVS